jgi:hypothetical protein
MQAYVFIVGFGALTAVTPYNLDRVDVSEEHIAYNFKAEEYE